MPARRAQTFATFSLASRLDSPLMRLRVFTVLPGMLLTLSAVSSCGTDANPRAARERASYTETIRGTEIRFDMVWVADGGLRPRWLQ